MPKLSSASRLDQGLERWIFKTATKNFWRVAGGYELEDLIQDGYVVWVTCRNRYRHVMDKPHFMALFKTSYINHITDLANKRTKLASIDCGMPDVELSVLNRMLGLEAEATTLATLLEHAPPLIKKAFALFCTESGRAKLAGEFERINGVRETTNQFLCRMLGADPARVNVPQMMKQYLAR